MRRTMLDPYAYSVLTHVYDEISRNMFLSVCDFVTARLKVNSSIWSILSHFKMQTSFSVSIELFTIILILLLQRIPTCTMLTTDSTRFYVLLISVTEVLQRACIPASIVPTLEALNGRALNDISLHLCNTNDLCNGSGRISEISTKMVLLSLFLVLVVSVFSK
jgi:hypothetical protein